MDIHDLCHYCLIIKKGIFCHDVKGNSSVKPDGRLSVTLFTVLQITIISVSILRTGITRYGTANSAHFTTDKVVVYVKRIHK